MFQRIAEFEPMPSNTGELYAPRVYGDQTVDGVWEGSVIFFPVLGGSVISTPRETTQTSYEALQHWALTLDRVYLKGALERALNTNTSVPISSVDLAQAETDVAAEVLALHRAADRAAVKAASETVVADMHERAAATARANAAEFAREAEEMEALADETVHETAEAAAVAHESAAREARAIAAVTSKTKSKKRAVKARHKPK
jgi:hypothetical protein